MHSFYLFVRNRNFCILLQGARISVLNFNHQSLFLSYFACITVRDVGVCLT